MILPKDLYYSLQEKVCSSSSYANIELAIKMRDDLEVYVLLTIPPEYYLETSQCEFTLFSPYYTKYYAGNCEQDVITSGYLLHSLFAAQFDPLNRIIKWGALPG